MGHDCIRHDLCAGNHAGLLFTLKNLDRQQPGFLSRSVRYIVGALYLQCFGPKLSASGSVAEWSKALV